MTKSPSVITDYLKTLPLYLLPQHLLTRGVHWLARCNLPLVKAALIHSFASFYRVEMSTAERPQLTAYSNFNDFFTRKLRSDARPVAGDTASIVSPVDGTISQIGTIEAGRLLQAKDRQFPLLSLLGNDTDLAAQFADGKFVTIYLSPRDYHRIHMPIRGHLRKQIYVPGRLFAVNDASTRVVPNLFARNERVITEFETEAGPMAVIMVGAFFVGSIETVWAGQITPAPNRTLQTTHFGPHGVNSITLLRGAELGRFNMGSTVILLFSKGRNDWSKTIEPGAGVRVGQSIGSWQ